MEKTLDYANIRSPSLKNLSLKNVNAKLNLNIILNINNENT